MRLILILLSTLLAVANPLKDKENHSLVSLWEDYYKAANKDNPKSQLNSLEKIQKKAHQQRLTWDFYDSWDKYVQISSSVNWKLRDSLKTVMRNELEAYNDATALFYYAYNNNLSESGGITFVMNNRSRLENNYNPEFYQVDNRITRLVFGGALSQFITNDFDYCLWALFSSDYTASNKEILNTRFKDQYPFIAFIELQGLDIEGHKAYEAKYKDKAVSLFSTQKILSDRFNKLEENGGTQEEYIKLKLDLEATIKKINAFKGDEKLIAQSCKLPENLLEQLNRKMVTAVVEDGEFRAYCRNSSKVRVKIEQNGKQILNQTLLNTKNSYYVFDTLRLDLNEKLVDGEYIISYGDNDKLEYTKYSLSIASRVNSKGLGIYVAEFMSGEPVRNCQLTLFDNEGKAISQSPVFPLNGFTAIPSAFNAKITPYAYIQASHTDSKGITHYSPKLRLGRNTSGEIQNVPTKQIDAIILTDRSIYNPGDSISFKSVIYETQENLSTIEKGSEVLALLLNPKGEKIDSVSLKTNDFGSVTATFVLEKDILCGQYQIQIRKDKSVYSKSVSVDEYVLPTFNLSWNSENRQYLPGDDVEVSGNIKSYSGHNLSSAIVRYTITTGRDVYKEGPIECDSEGNFTILFTSLGNKLRYDDYVVRVVVIDSTGETWEFNRFVNFTNWLDINIRPLNSTKGRFSLGGQEWEQYGMILSENIANIEVNSPYKNVQLSYVLDFNDEKIEEGLITEPILQLLFDGRDSGLYKLKVKAMGSSDSGLEYENENELFILKAFDSDKALNSDIIGFFREIDGYGLSLQLGATGGPVWAVVELYGEGNVLLDKKIVKLIGQKGKVGSLQLVSFDKEDYYPEDLRMNVLYFRDKHVYRYSKDFDNTREERRIPIRFTRFLDTTSPGLNYSFAIETKPFIEACATIFDASTETIRRNAWSHIRPASYRGSTVNYSSVCGSNDSRWIYQVGRGRGIALLNETTAISESVAVSKASADAISNDNLSSENNIREFFSNSLLWEPFLLSDENGRINLSFKTSDKLSKYYVQLFAHDKDFNNASVRKEFTVTIPVKVSIVQPRYLYSSDKYIANMNISNNFPEDIEGDVYFEFPDGVINSKRVIVPGKGSINFSASPGDLKEGELTLIAGFRPVNNEYVSDAVKVSIPIFKDTQAIIEAHSALLISEEDKNSVIKKLRSEFTNSSSENAETSIISIREMLEKAIPEEINRDEVDAISLSGAIYSAILGPHKVSEEKLNALISKMLNCVNSDGGFAWFPGMNSSPAITAKVLERIFYLEDKCPDYLKDLTAKAIKYLDTQYFSDDKAASWRGGLSLEEYLYVRSMYCGEFFSLRDKSLKALTSFAKDAKKYLTPREERGLNGDILGKARRALTLYNFLSQKGSKELFEAWGLNIRVGLKLSKSLKEDAYSLSQYAVSHKNGGVYFPNAVMPYRGLLGSELNAAAALCRLFEVTDYKEIAEGIRLWIMTQKETQQWDSDPAYIDALICVAAGSEKTLSTKVIVLKNSTELHFKEIKANGNGFKIQSGYYLNGKLLQEGDKLQLGDKIIARHVIWSEENRSFVSVRLPRASCLRPQVQNSGFFSWRYSAYRYVRSNETIYMFESYPEETTTVSEEYYVTQEGVFSAPVPTVESSYAPHYRCNGETIEIVVESTQP